VADHLYATCNWWASPLMLGGFLHSAQGYMRALRDVSPEFDQLRLLSPTAGPTPVHVDDPGFPIKMAQLLCDPRSNYTSPDSRGRPTDASVAADGWSVAFMCGLEGRERFVVRVADGSRSVAAPLAAATVKSLWEADAFAEDLIERALIASIAFWRPGNAWMTTNSFKAAVRSDSKQHLVVGWRTYLGRCGRSLPTLQLVARSALPRGTLARIVPPGGVLIGLQGDVFTPTDPWQLDEALEIRNGLRPHGLLDLPKDIDTIGRRELIYA
jgi:hypothetical protein